MNDILKENADNDSPIKVEETDWLSRIRGQSVETYCDPEAGEPSVCSAPTHRTGSSPIANEIARRQRLAEERDADPALQDVWDGSSTQPDIDSLSFPIEEGGESGEDFERRVRQDDPVMAGMWDDVFAQCAAEQAAEKKNDPILEDRDDHPGPRDWDCPCDDCNGIVLFV